MNLGPVHSARREADQGRGHAHVLHTHVHCPMEWLWWLRTCGLAMHMKAECLSCSVWGCSSEDTCMVEAERTSVPLSPSAYHAAKMSWRSGLTPAGAAADASRARIHSMTSGCAWHWDWQWLTSSLVTYASRVRQNDWQRSCRPVKLVPPGLASGNASCGCCICGSTKPGPSPASLLMRLVSGKTLAATRPQRKSSTTGVIGTLSLKDWDADIGNASAAGRLMASPVATRLRDRTLNMPLCSAESGPAGSQSRCRVSMSTYER